jgi:hypothetical protein
MSAERRLRLNSLVEISDLDRPLGELRSAASRIAAIVWVFMGGLISRFGVAALACSIGLHHNPASLAAVTVGASPPP